jgi:hypothetical protein
VKTILPLTVALSAEIQQHKKPRKHIFFAPLLHTKHFDPVGKVLHRSENASRRNRAIHAEKAKLRSIKQSTEKLHANSARPNAAKQEIRTSMTKPQQKSDPPLAPTAVQSPLQGTEFADTSCNTPSPNKTRILMLKAGKITIERKTCRKRSLGCLNHNAIRQRCAHLFQIR